ncbi:iron-containing alcohol dehydrogenase [Spongiibacter nanhainus]|uniref:Iron-containing alcohol dehydrogenase n=1 Tax=Spongiibacter nanhainus TaxID=2794344 RepID=A0A7T4R035_9GAMM|nr:iron-containing alcohol dehydrogenase [Spongiibacter nanhainus]QQD17849.1 iron-containing alcohol dehydrogenase [Spongiibacter nanhainus]
MLKTAIHKIYLTLMATVVRFMPPDVFTLFAGESSSKQLARHIANHGSRRLLIVSDKPLVDLGLITPIVEECKGLGIECQVFDGVLPDPTFNIVDDGLEVFKSHNADAVLAIGGGSSIDTGKTIASAATNGFEPRKLAGYFKVKIPPIPLYAIPTTSGTGSEVTKGAVIADSDTHLKAYVADPKMVPLAVALDPGLLTGMPPAITAATGMDALTHAIEAYISVWCNPRCERYALSAIKMIFAQLPTAYSEGSNIAAREQLSLAACYAGLAINDTNIGNVHALAHQLGRVYSTPHGLANAIVLPYVLETMIDACGPRLASLARELSFSDSRDDNEAAKVFISKVVELNSILNIPTGLDKLARSDFGDIAKAATKEGSLLPVPRLMNKSEFDSVLERCLLPS